MEYRTLAVKDIKPNPNQPRHDFGDDDLAELAESIKQSGVLVPLLVRPVNGTFEIVHGGRRWRASQIAGLTEVPAMIQELNDTEAFIIGLTENIQRRSLNPMEEAQAFKWLQDQGYTQSKVAEVIGKTQQYVASRLTLLNLPDTVQEKITTRVVSASHGEVLALLKSTTLAEKLATQAEKLATQVEKDRLTVRQLEKAVQTHNELDEDLLGFEKLGVTPPTPGIRLDNEGKVFAERAYRIRQDLRKAEENAAIQRQGYYVGFWNGCLPKIQDNSYPLVSEEEWELAHKFHPDDYYEDYWGDKFPGTREPVEGDLGEEIFSDWQGLRYILPAGRWGWYDFPIERAGEPLIVANTFQWPDGITCVKLVRRRVFCPYIIHSENYAKLLAVLSGKFCFAGIMATLYILGGLPTGAQYWWFEQHFPAPDDVVPRRRLVAALKTDLKLTYEPLWQDISPCFIPNGEWQEVLESRSDVFEHIRSMAKTMTESKRRMVMKQIGGKGVSQGKGVTMDKGFIKEVEMKGLLLGMELPAQKVHEEICPECPFKMGFCEWRMKLFLADPELVFVCKGMRAWVSKGN